MSLLIHRPLQSPRRLGLWLAMGVSALVGCEESAPPAVSPPAPADAGPGSGHVPALDAATINPDLDAAVVVLPPVPAPMSACELDNHDPGPALIRRLNRKEYDNTVRDLLGEDLRPSNGFLPDEEFLGFDNQASSLQISPLHAEQYMAAAELMSDRVLARRADFVHCDPAQLGDAACLRQFIADFGLRAWRRPLETDEIDGLAGLYDVAAQLDPPQFDSALRLAVQAMLQSPNFLFRIEVGSPVVTQRLGHPAGVDPMLLKLNGYEIAARLSYLLWQSMPDAILLDAAANGGLETADQVRAQAHRMLADAKAHGAMLDFFDQWLRYAKTADIERDPTYYPDFVPEDRDLLVTESRTFVEDLLWGEHRDLKTLFNADYTFMNGPLAEFYGVPGVTGDTFQRVPLDTTRRAGILTQGAVMAATAKPNMTSPVFRGAYVRERILCTPLPPPPPNIPVVPPSPDPNSSTRQKFEEHDRNPACAGCHKLMDPIGYGFENFDAVGRWRTEETGHPIDPSCELTSTRDTDGTFANAAEMVRQLAESEQVQRCVVTQFFRFAQGRGETNEDLCGLERLYQGYKAGGRDFLSLVEQLTTTESFRYRRRQTEDGITP